MNVSNVTEKDGSVKTSSWDQSTNTEDLLVLPVDELLSRLNTSRAGLSSEEVKNRLGIYGPNELAKRKRRTGAVELLYHLRNPLVLILLMAGVISAYSDVRAHTEPVSASIIFVIVILSIVLDVYQESKAVNAAELLREKVTTTATALRDSAKKEVKLSEIVPGDVVVLSAGDIVPADSRVIVAKDLFVNQSALTGESFPVEKTPEPLKAKSATITAWDNYVFLGTSIVSGIATALVMKTGSFTEYGKIAKKLASREPETDFERGLRRFGFLIMEVTFFLVLFVFMINATVVKRDPLESLLFALALAVGLTPELLPMIISVNLSQGALAMSKRGVITKRLASIQNFGSMDVLCTDKTGTLTENRITLVSHVDVDGNDDEKVLLYSFLNSSFQTGLKSPLDEAILRRKEVTKEGYEKIDEVPFDFTRKRVSVVVEHLRQRFFISKGAPEEISKVCSYCETHDDVLVDLSSSLQQRIERKYNDLSAQGYRVLAVAYKKVREEKIVYSVKDESDMVFLGFVAFLDPPKETASESVQLLRKAGIQLKILTGDNELVTKKICDQLGFEIKRMVGGNEILQMDDDALGRVVEEANIFTRVTPAQKDRIMNALKKNGHVVGFLGDGINDAPSLKTADVSISVDNAADVAKESADIILSRTDLTVLEEGVLDGRKTFGNTMKYIMMGTSSNFGNMFSVAGASVFIPFLPMLPTQILLNNLLYDLSEVTIPTDDVDPEVSQRAQRWDMSFIRRFMVVLGPVSSIFDFLTFFIMLSLFPSNQPLFRTAWFLESICTQTLVIFVIRTRLTAFYKSRPSRPLLWSTLAVVAVALVLPFTIVGTLFGFVKPPLFFFAILTGLIGAYLTLVVFVKKWFYRRHLHLIEKM
jgi:Mg2+-importing ATPase